MGLLLDSIWGVRKVKVDPKMFELSPSTARVATSRDRGDGAGAGRGGKQGRLAFGIVPVRCPTESPGRMAAETTYTDSRRRKVCSKLEVTGCDQHG